MYCTQADLEQRLDPQVLRALADDDQDGLADTAVIGAAIADAGALIDARLHARYSVPFDPAPEIIRAVAAALAIYLLLTRRHDSAPAEHRRRYETALALSRTTGQRPGRARRCARRHIHPPSPLQPRRR
ncbi:MAG: DUF1320 domain-containing protein [Candidatus Sumerlaeia bacterium]|nr:DUF1320 domain-containing protein [Candidatus Sumerlaeia bacterium]